MLKNNYLCVKRVSKGVRLLVDEVVITVKNFDFDKSVFNFKFNSIKTRDEVGVKFALLGFVLDALSAGDDVIITYDNDKFIDFKSYNMSAGDFVNQILGDLIFKIIPNVSVIMTKHFL